MAELLLDREYHARGIQLLCGVDEAGRVPLAGPVFAAAVILSPEPGDTRTQRLQKTLGEEARSAL